MRAICHPIGVVACHGNPLSHERHRARRWVRQAFRLLGRYYATCYDRLPTARAAHVEKRVSCKNCAVLGDA